jgi:acyl carrier protein
MHNDIHKFIVDFFLFGREDGLANSDSLLDRGIIDSTGVLELVAFLEKTYAIKVQNDELLPENLDSIDAIVSFLERKKQATNCTN